MQLDHVNIRTNDLDATVAFYRDVIGLEVGDRPNFSFGGAWLYGTGRPILHLVLTNDPVPPPQGPVDHVAFRTDDLDGVVARLDAKRIDYAIRDLPGGRGRQCFLQDPNGVRVEIGEA
jgi:catechol 2,3-dioxygenase-like lactoylglutathione lyase family enzyme